MADERPTGSQSGKRLGLDAIYLLAFVLLVAVMFGKLGIPVSMPVAVQTYFVCAAALMLMGASYLFHTIDWWGVRAKSGRRFENRTKADITLNAISIAAIFLILFLVIVALISLLVYIGAYDVSGAVAIRIAIDYVFVLAAVLLVYMMAIVMRSRFRSLYHPPQGALTAGHVMAAFGAFWILMGALFASGVPQRGGFLAGIEPRQAIFLVNVGILLDFVGMRYRLRLPSIAHEVIAALESTRRADETVRQAMQKRAMRTYLLGMAFVVVSMTLAAVIATGAVNLSGGRTTWALLVFYGMFAIIILALIFIRVMQAQQAKKAEELKDDPLEALAQQRRRSPEEALRVSVYVVTGAFAALAFVFCVLTAYSVMPWHKKFMTDFFILALLFGAGPYGIFYNRDLKRIEAMEDKFPDLLRDIADSARAGMTLPKALVNAAKGTYGALTDDLRKMAYQVEWGVAFGDALGRFADRTRTPLIERTVSLVRQAERAGGNVVDVLTAASSDAREIQQILRERQEQMKVYNVVVYIAFFVFMVVVIVLTAQFIPPFAETVTQAQGQAVGGLKFKAFDPEDFNTLFFHAAVIQAIGGGMVGGVFTRGQPVAGFVHVAAMLIAAWFAFRILIGVL